MTTCANATVQRLGRIEMAKMQLLELLMIIQCQRGTRENKSNFAFTGTKIVLDIEAEGYPGALYTGRAEMLSIGTGIRLGPVSHALAFKKSSGWCKMNVNGALEDHEHWGSIQNQIQDTER